MSGIIPGWDTPLVCSLLNFLKIVSNNVQGIQYGLMYFADWTHGLSWKQLLNNNPGIIHLLQHWRHHYRATTAGTALP